MTTNGSGGGTVGFQHVASPIMLFDGQCLFCNGAARFVIHFERKPGKMMFAALQSKAGRKLLDKAGLNSDIHKLNSFVVVDETGQAHTRWKAAVQMGLTMGGFWWLAARVLNFVLPTFLGNFFYDVGWRYRRLILGESDTCVRPTPALKMRIIPDGDASEEVVTR